MVSTFVAWYEGSAITYTYNSIEWEYSTPFTHFFNHNITSGQDISQLDYFVYSAKFQPMFPAIMIVSVIYMVSVIGFYLLSHITKFSIGYWGLICSLLILFSVFLFNSVTIGGKVIFWITCVSALFCLIVVGVHIYKIKCPQININ